METIRPDCVILAHWFDPPERPFASQTLLVIQSCEWSGMEICAVDPTAAAGWPEPVAGWQWRESRFQPVRVQLPRVLWDRKLSRTADQVEAFRLLCSQLNRCQVPVVNPPALARLVGDKWTTAEFLIRYQLPTPLTRLGDPALLARYLADGQACWLKPREGTKGLGLLHLAPLPDGRLQIHDSNGVHSEDRAEFFAGRELTGSTASLILQVDQPMPLADGRRWDLRLLLQRMIDGSWNADCVYGRIAAPGLFATNLARGGTLADALPLLEATACNRRSALRILEEARDIAVRTASALVTELAEVGERIVELGIDMVVTPEGNPLILEINSKPGRSIHLLPADSTIARMRHDVVQRPFDRMRQLLVEGTR